VPPQIDYENPFDGLAIEELAGLRRLVRPQSRVESGDADAAADASALRAELESTCLDVDGLLAKRLEIMALRRAAATGVNESLVGETVRIPGYVVPLELADQKAALTRECRMAWLGCRAGAVDSGQSVQVRRCPGAHGAPRARCAHCSPAPVNACPRL
jgi:hypothetical protein